MGFYFRKSVNLGGLRFNFSKSGVGVSTGVKGFRVGSVKIPCVPVGKQKLYFFPDKILIIEGKKIGALSYKNIGISVTNGNFIETEMKPWDGTVVNYTYKYVNKNGGPDRRFSNNPRYPIMSYSYITFYGDNGFNECIMLSKQGVGHILKEQIFKLQNHSIHTENNTENQIAAVNGITGAKNNVNEIAEINNIIKSAEKYKSEKDDLEPMEFKQNVIESNLFRQEEKKERWQELKMEINSNNTITAEEEIKRPIQEPVEVKDKKKNMFYKK